jgi:hypothetical protein
VFECGFEEYTRIDQEEIDQEAINKIVSVPLQKKGSIADLL